MAEQTSGNTGMAFILGGVVVALGVVLYIMSGGSLFGIGGGTSVTVETPTIVVPTGEGGSN